MVGVIVRVVALRGVIGPPVGGIIKLHRAANLCVNRCHGHQDGGADVVDYSFICTFSIDIASSRSSCCATFWRSSSCS